MMRVNMSMTFVGWGGIKDFGRGGYCPEVAAKDLTGVANGVASGIGSVLCVRRCENVGMTGLE